MSKKKVKLTKVQKKFLLRSIVESVQNPLYSIGYVRKGLVDEVYREHYSLRNTVKALMIKGIVIPRPYEMSRKEARIQIALGTLNNYPVQMLPKIVKDIKKLIENYINNLEV